MAIAVAIVGCIGESPGTVVLGLNESDQDVVVASSHHGVGPFVLPAHTWGRLFDDHGNPSGEITVFNVDCMVLVKLPLTRALDTLRVTPAGVIELLGHMQDVMPSGVDRAPDNPDRGGMAWETAACP